MTAHHRRNLLTTAACKCQKSSFDLFLATPIYNTGEQNIYGRRAFATVNVKIEMQLHIVYRV